MYSVLRSTQGSFQLTGTATSFPLFWICSFSCPSLGGTSRSYTLSLYTSTIDTYVCRRHRSSILRLTRLIQNSNVWKAMREALNTDFPQDISLGLETEESTVRRAGRGHPPRPSCVPAYVIFEITYKSGPKNWVNE